MGDVVRRKSAGVSFCAEELKPSITLLYKPEPDSKEKNRGKTTPLGSALTISRSSEGSLYVSGESQ